MTSLAHSPVATQGGHLDAYATTGTSPPADDGRSIERLLTTRELAQVLNQTPRWVLRMAKNEGLPHYRLSQALRYRITEIEDWLQRRHSGEATQIAADAA